MMPEEKLQVILEAEEALWSAKPIDQLIHELKSEVNYERDQGDGYCQFAVALLENKLEYIHVRVSVDDGSYELSRTPLCTTFILYRGDKNRS